MTQEAVNLLKKLEFFQALAPGSKEKLLGQISLITFDLGQKIATSGVISGRVLILLQGQVRLIVDDQEGLHSFGKFEVGSVLGAASLLCGVGLDNLIASSSVLAASISDELWAEYYANDASFRSWCGSVWVSVCVGRGARDGGDLSCCQIIGWHTGNSRVKV